MSIETIINYALGIAGIIIGVVVSIYTYVNSKEAKEPKIYYQTYRDIEKINDGTRESNVRVYYKSEEVERVFTTYVWFWNHGKKPILKTDIPASSELKLVLFNKENDLKILDSKIVTQSRGPVNATASQVDKASLRLEFDFLDHKDGLALEIQHTGGLDVMMRVDGVILGSADGVKVNTVSSEDYVNPAPPNKTPFLVIIALTLFILWLWLVCGAVAVYQGVHLFFPEKMPKIFEIFERAPMVDPMMTSSQLDNILRVNMPDATDESIQAVIDAVFINGKQSQWSNKISFWAFLFMFVMLPFLYPFIFLEERYPFPRSLTIGKRK